MDTTNKLKEVSQTIFVEYSLRDKTEPCIEAYYFMPEQKLKILIGSIVRQVDVYGNTEFILKDGKGEAFPWVATSLREAKSEFRTGGQAMAEQRFAEEKKRLNEISALRKSNAGKEKTR